MYVYLKIPDVKAFRDFLIEHFVDEYAVVQLKRRDQRDQISMHFLYRLTARLSRRQEIAVCDVPFWCGPFVDAELEEVNSERKKTEEQIETIMSSGKVKLTGSQEERSCPMKAIDGEYSTET